MKKRVAILKLLAFCMLLMSGFYQAEAEDLKEFTILTQHSLVQKSTSFQDEEGIVKPEQKTLFSCNRAEEILQLESRNSSFVDGLGIGNNSYCFKTLMPASNSQMGLNKNVFNGRVPIYLQTHSLRL